jgi:hypothetical protein
MKLTPTGLPVDAVAELQLRTLPPRVAADTLRRGGWDAERAFFFLAHRIGPCHAARAVVDAGFRFPSPSSGSLGGLLPVLAVDEPRAQHLWWRLEKQRQAGHKTMIGEADNGDGALWGGLAVAGFGLVIGVFSVLATRPDFGPAAPSW